IHSARAFVGFKSAMSEGVDLDTSLELLTNLNDENLTTTNEDGSVIDGGALKDTRINAHLAINAKIGKNLAFQAAFDVKFDNRPSALSIKGLAMGFVPEASTIDTIMKATLIYSFF
ncbi:MAG: hypothetical protein NT062_37175, partial [Proteobacteria bacterium]|nr:hypothetical protein [Pseudomonadota bacterium]